MPVSAINKHIVWYIKGWCEHNQSDSDYIDSIIVSLFIYTNHISNIKNNFLANFILPKENSDVQKFLTFFDAEGYVLTLEDLVSIFEYVISPADKEVNGAVYTPSYIREYIIREILCEWPKSTWCEKKYGDIACGCGGFFLTLAQILHEFTGCTFFEIFKNNIYGVDIQKYSIQRSKILLILLALLYSEDKEEFEFNLFEGNSLVFQWNKIPSISNHGGFDAIVGNPPYVGASKMDIPTKKLVKKWSVAKSGKADMYIPFFQIAIENLKVDGWLGYITVNNFYRSQNGKCLRQYFAQHGYYIKMVDFGSEQIFRGRSTYTCLCFVNRAYVGYVDYMSCKSQSLSSIKPIDYTRIPYLELNENQWYLSKREDVSFIDTIETVGRPLEKICQIRNGFATLKNSVYLFSVENEDENYYYFCKFNREYKVEKSICRNAVKPNILKRESDLIRFTEKLIFPYVEHQGDVALIEEEYFKREYPYAYSYLSDNREILAERDKGTKKYESWYAYGRTQALNIHGFKLLFPYISEKPYFVMSKDRDLLFYNGYAIISDSLMELRILQKVLSSNIFWNYIKLTSKPYGGDYYALAKNYIKKFSVYAFTEEERQELLSIRSQKRVDKWLEKFYHR